MTEIDRQVYWRLRTDLEKLIRERREAHDAASRAEVEARIQHRLVKERTRQIEAMLVALAFGGESGRKVLGDLRTLKVVSAE